MAESLGTGLSLPNGLQLARELLASCVPHPIHDYILEGVCKAIDGINLVSTVKTSGGKSGYFYCYLLLIQALTQLSTPCPLLLRKYSSNPAMVIVYPTKSLQEEMEIKFRNLKLSVLTINEDTLRDAIREKRDLWAECVKDVSILLISPEQLSTVSFDQLIQNKIYAACVCCLAVDELHLVQDWGDPAFRDAFRQIGLVRSRMPRSVSFIGVTGTLLAGPETVNLFKTLGLEPGSFHFQRLSNLRTDIQHIYRVLRHGLTGYVFPDLDWIFEGGRKIIIYGDTIYLGFRLKVYACQKYPRIGVRIYNDICDPKNRTKTRTMFLKDPQMQVIIATDSLIVGIDLLNVQDVVNLGCKHPNHDNQKGITYVSKAMMERAKKMVADGDKGGKKTDQGLHIGMARILVADCVEEVNDILYDNPPSSVIICRCETCVKVRLDTRQSTRCNCSGCKPEPPLPPLKRAKAALPIIPVLLRLTEAMENIGRADLKSYRFRIWNENRATAGLMLPVAFLPDKHIQSLLDNFAQLLSLEDLQPYISQLHFLNNHHESLFAEILSLRAKFATMPLLVTKARNPASQVEASTSLSSQSVAQGVNEPTAYDNFWAGFISRAPLQTVTIHAQPVASGSKRSFPKPESKMEGTVLCTPSPRRTRKTKRNKEKEN
ncbi:P-loop containing nucleoside triphosphate hydrolase protein [Mycena floridula]|nr:P-loop containing nucleoside triphosphate hydrolase protein [Mycena floridula]